MAQQIPIQEIIEEDGTSCRVLALNVPTDYATNEAHRHNYYELLFFISGSGTHMIDFDGHEITGKSMHFVSAGQVHALNRDKKTKGYVVAFSKEFMYLNSTDKNIINDFPAFNKTAAPILKLDTKATEEIHDLIKAMELAYESKGSLKEKILGAYVSVLLLKCKELFNESNENKTIDGTTQQLLVRFNDLLEEHFIQMHKVNEYADLLFVSPNHLSETIKKVTGKTAGDLIQDRLVLEAKRLLLHSSVTAKEIAYHLNFNDPSYFSRFFKNNTNLSPEEFRKQAREKYQH